MNLREILGFDGLGKDELYQNMNEINNRLMKENYTLRKECSEPIPMLRKAVKNIKGARISREEYKEGVDLLQELLIILPMALDVKGEL